MYGAYTSILRCINVECVVFVLKIEALNGNMRIGVGTVRNFKITSFRHFLSHSISSWPNLKSCLRNLSRVPSVRFVPGLVNQNHEIVDHCNWFYGNFWIVKFFIMSLFHDHVGRVFCEWSYEYVLETYVSSRFD